MATYQDLVDAIARVRACTGDAGAWMRGLSGADLAVASSPVTVAAPGAIDAVLAKIHAAHPDVFGPRTAPPSPPPAPAGQEGSAAAAIRDAEAALAQQHSATAQLDLQVVSAVLNAHTTHQSGRAALDELQRDIETAVLSCTDLDTPAGARAFQRYLLGKLRDIRAVVETADLDASSKAALTAALASLYSAASGDPKPEPNPPEPQPDPQPAPRSERPMTEAAEPYFGADPLLDSLPIPGYPPPAADPAPAVPPAQPPAAIPAMPTLPSLGGATLPAPGLPLGSGMSFPSGPAFPGPGGLADPISPADANLARTEPDPAAEPEMNPDPNNDAQPVGEPGEPTDDTQTTVRLPDGDTVTAASPALAKVVAAAVAGTPIPDAFRAQGITIPAPGSPVTQPVDEVALAPADVGILADRHALALGNGKVVLDGRIQPIASVTGPGFLGWEHPPGPAATTPPRTGGPTPTRPAVTAGPSG